MPVSVARKTRNIPTALRRALLARDRGCRFPGCDNTRYIDAHHVRHWAHGGETSLGNLVLLCRRHHRLVHEDGYTIDSERRFHYPWGGAIPNVPDPPRGSAAKLLWLNNDLEITPRTNRNGYGDPMDLGLAVEALLGIARRRGRR